ncbi:MAG: hypothetical protein QOK05_1419 [Chloroflexota bacterium]|jgi:hypothetical protein|nr:hypothetical protein [Chloroflexota bacterium]
MLATEPGHPGRKTVEPGSAPGWVVQVPAERIRAYGTIVRPLAARADAPAWFRRGMILFSAWVILGAYSDTWAHHHFLLTSVVTPFHAVVFGGLSCEGAFVAWGLWRLGARPRAWQQAIPRGYGLAVAGCALALVGAPLDLCWHLLFGIDQGFGSVTSPTHILIGCSTGLMTTGPLRSAWGGRVARAPWSALLSATLAFSMLFFFDEATHPLLAPWAANFYPRMMLPDTAQQLGTIEIVLWAILISACILPLLLRFDLPFGAFTCLLGVTGVLTTLIVAPQPLIVVGPIGGLVADELYRALKPSRTRAVQLRVFALVVPMTMVAIYFLILAAAGGTWWPVNVWAGC